MTRWSNGYQRRPRHPLAGQNVLFSGQTLSLQPIAGKQVWLEDWWANVAEDPTRIMEPHRGLLLSPDAVYVKDLETGIGHWLDNAQIVTPP